MYTERTTRGLAKILLALVAVAMVTIIIIMLTAGSPRIAVSAESGRFISYANSGARVVPLASVTVVDRPRTPALLVAEDPVYYNWQIQKDGIDNDRNFGPNLYSESLTNDDALGLFYIHMSSDPRACAATALGLSKELGFSAMPDEAYIENETDRVNAAAAHYEVDHAYWQRDYDAITEAVAGLWYNIEEIGDYNSACYMIFNGYDAAPTVIVSPSYRTGGHALVFYKSDGTKIRFRLECSFQLVDVLVTSESKPEPDYPEETTVTTPNTVTTTTVVTTNPETTTQPESTTTAPVTTTIIESTTTAPESTTTSQNTTTVPESTTTSQSTTTVPETTTTSKSTTTPETTTRPVETTTTKVTTIVTESTTTTTKVTTSVTTTPETTTESTTTTVVTTTPTTTTTLEAKNPEQALDAKDDVNIGGDTNASDVNDEPDLPGAPATGGNQDTDTHVTVVAVLPSKNELTVVQLAPKA